jgi:hypothetical protein
MVIRLYLMVECCMLLINHREESVKASMIVLLILVAISYVTKVLVQINLLEGKFGFATYTL